MDNKFIFLVLKNLLLKKYWKIIIQNLSSTHYISCRVFPKVDLIEDKVACPHSTHASRLAPIIIA